MEIEIKFQLTQASRKALESKLRIGGGKAKQLIAAYFDTPDRALAMAGYSLRLRKEGRIWFQTLKSSGGPASLVRSEQNIRLGAISYPQLDLARHLETDEGRRLTNLLPQTSDISLACRYTTAIRRVSLSIGTRTCIEYALDVGEISTSPEDKQPPLVLPVCELEIELKSGPVSSLLTAARKLIFEQEVWIDVRSKAQRGNMLASGALVVAPAKTRPINLKTASLNVLAKEAVAECARQVLQNASQLTSSEGGGPEHVHQLRIGLRRLRSAIKLFSSLVNDGITEWESKAKLLASGLGGNRDIDMMAESLWPRLRKAGAPLVELPLQDNLLSPGDLIRDKCVQLWLLDLLAFELKEPDELIDGEWTKVLPVIQDWHARCKKDALRFERFDVVCRHRLRKRFKRLKYALEFIESKLPAKRYERFIKKLGVALDALGRYNDIQVAMQCYREVIEIDPRAWFALGWLHAQNTKAEARCAEALASFHSAEPPWDRID